MTVKEFVDVVNDVVIDYARIYELHWNPLWNDYDYKYTDKRINSKKDLESYYDCELSSFELIAQFGEYDDSAIYIKMPKLTYKNGQEIECPCCGEKIIIEFDTARCEVCGWMCADAELDDIMEE